MFNLAFFLLQDAPDPAAIQHTAMLFITLLPIIILCSLAIIVVPFWFICKKAGFSPWFSLFNVIPFGTLVLLYVLAFSQWKTVSAPQTSSLPPQA